jgi:hypothetical protein
MESPELICPECGVHYQNYREYFACWTSHLDQKISGETKSTLAPFEHGDAVIYYKENPSTLEEGLKILASEVGIFHGRIDLIGVDRNKNLVLIDVDNGHDPRRKEKQLKRYKKSIQWMGTNIFGLRPRDYPDIRLLIVNPNKYVREVRSSNGFQ